MASSDCLLSVRGLKTWFGNGSATVRAVDDVSFDLPRGGVVALVGESGCGKTVTALSLARLIQTPPGRYESGQILFAGEDVLRMGRGRLTDLRGREIAYVFQEPGTALNPTMRAGPQVMEAVRTHLPGVDPAVECIRALTMVGLTDPAVRMRSYPHELSGGMKQRVMIAMALVCRPKLLVADEPTTALDVTIQAQIMGLLRDLRKRLDTAILLITHNMALVADMAESVHVMYAGRIVESGSVEDVLARPAHPYTCGLLQAVPRLYDQGWSRSARAAGIPGTVPSAGNLPAGCKFAPRCPKCQAVCREAEPSLQPVSRRGGEADCAAQVRCYFPTTEEQ